MGNIGCTLQSMPLLRPALSVGLFVSVLAACGSSTADDVNGAGGPGNGSAFNTADGGSGTVNPTDVDPSSACATSSAVGKGVPASLVFMFDRSGSMKGDKWDASSAALKAFFADAGTKGLEASLQFFPLYPSNNKTCKEDKDCGNGDTFSCVNKLCAEMTCADADYKAPAVTMRPLPNATEFAPVIDNVGLDDNTPTLPALRGALAYAKDVQASGKKAAVILVTDGEPNHCGSSVASVAAAAQADAAAVKTYVIGVGKSLTNLNDIAAAGGTTSAIIVDTASNAQIADDLTKALGLIASQALSCDYSIPAPPNGQTIDPNKVNVRHAPSSGAPATLTYNATCNGPGWHYDNPSTPGKILLCPATCDVVMKDPGAKVEVFFGCAVKGGIPR